MHQPRSLEGGTDFGRRVRVSRWLGAAATSLALVLVVLVVAPSARAESGSSYECTDPSQVYFGNPRLFRRPAQISADEVYRRIPEYQEILEKGLTDRDPRYHLLMRKASERFTKAVKEAAGALRHDLVAERGTIRVGKDAEQPPDRTSEVVARIG